MKDVGHGLDAPFAAFDILRAGIGIAQGALFLRDYGSDELRPWASVGYDPTTRNRLRIRRTTFDAIFGDQRTPVVLEGPRLSVISELFSNREFTSLQSVACLPLETEDQSGMIMISASEFLRVSVDLFRVVLAAVGPDVTELVLASPTRRALTASQITVFGPDDLPTVLREVSDHAVVHQMSILGIKVSPRDLYDRVREQYQELQLHQVEEDFLRLIAGMFGAISNVIRIPGGDVLLLMLNEKNIDGELVVRQIEVTAESLFDGIGAVPAIESEVHAVEPDSAGIELFLHSLSV